MAITVVFPLPFGAMVNRAVCKLDEALQVMEYYETTKQAAIYNNMTVRQVYTAIKNYPSKHKTIDIRLCFYDCILVGEEWKLHDALNIYVSNFGRIDRDGTKIVMGKYTTCKKRKIKIKDQWYFVDDLVKELFQ